MSDKKSEPLLVNDVSDRLQELCIFDPGKGNVKGNRGMITKIIETVDVGGKFLVQNVEVMKSGNTDGDPRSETWALPGWFVKASEWKDEEPEEDTEE